MCSRLRAQSKGCCRKAVPDSGIDARAARRRFERAARTYAAAARLEAEVGARMLERLDYVKLQPRRVLDAGSGPPQRALGRRYRNAEVIALDFALAMLRIGKRKLLERNPPKAVSGDIARLPIAARAIDLVWSNMALHWVADPLAAFKEFHRVLAVDGLLMFSTLGPDTLAGLRAAAGDARVHRFADMHDLGDMLVAAGFAEPVMDMERLTIVYADGAALLADLRASGQTCASAGRARGLAGARFRAALDERLAEQRRGGKLPVGFEVVYGHAWKAAPKRAADGRSIVQFVQ
ncbi:MAG: methyltransferase domain-containing protein [Betaproteobacteria bacterium]|nr:methyltransferase domain-containing protein [Betaproteobacteria bacterium]